MTPDGTPTREGAPPDAELVRRCVDAAWRAVHVHDEAIKPTIPAPTEADNPAFWRQVRAVMAVALAARPGQEAAPPTGALELRDLQLQLDNWKVDHRHLTETLRETEVKLALAEATLRTRYIACERGYCQEGYSRGLAEGLRAATPTGGGEPQ